VIAVAAALLSITIVAKDDALTTIRAGLTTVTFENQAGEPHSIRFVRLTVNHTAEQFGTWMKTGGKPPAWLSTVGGIALLGPNRTEEYTVTFAAGSYVVVDGDRFGPMRVENGPSTLPALVADVDVRVRDHGYQLSAPVPGGKPLWHLRNAGTEPHQALVVRLPEGVAEFTERAWIAGESRGPSPGDPMGGVLELPAGAEAWFRVELPAGRYLLICGELEEEGRHFDLGMIYRFEIE
jgi:hypothetical protein